MPLANASDVQIPSASAPHTLQKTFVTFLCCFCRSMPQPTSTTTHVILGGPWHACGLEGYKVLLMQVEEERRERTLLEAKVRRLQSMLANSQPQQEELIKTIHFLERVRTLSESTCCQVC